jgi:Fe-Mn family superoxide dismutase
MANYVLPKLKYGYDDLAPILSSEQLRIHYEKHHQAYVNGANALLEKLEKARKDNVELDMKATLKELSFNIAGHTLHSLFWANLAKGGKNMPKQLSDALSAEFGSVERFKAEFTKAAASVEGSGWAALGFCSQTKRPIIMQIEKHNVNVIPHYDILFVIDVFEHAYYLDYKNDRAKFIENLWSIVDWQEVSKRLEEASR